MSAPRPSSPPEVLAAQFQAFVDKDLEQLMSYWQADCVFRDMAEPEPRQGLAALREYMAANMERMHDVDARFTALLGSGQQALAEIEMDVTWHDESTPPGGVRVKLSFCVVDEVRDGRVARETVYWNPALLEAQLAAAGCPDPTNA